jgi:cbb3-type cytochrome oxidase subunit 3
MEMFGMFGLGINVPDLIAQLFVFAALIALVWFAFRARNRTLRRR